MAEKKVVERKRMTESEVGKMIAKFAKTHDLKGKELEDKLRHIAATRLGALERYAAKQRKPRAKKTK